MEEMMKLTKENFDAEVMESKIPVLVDFYADWCGPCKMMAPVLDGLAAEANGKYKVAKLNIDEEMEIAMRYRVMSIPTFLVFKDGKVVSTAVGATSAEDLKTRLGL